MNMHGLNVDADAIGAGLYRIIQERGQEAIVAFGMIPADLMDMVRKQLRDKVIEEAGKKVGATAQELELMGVVDDSKVSRIVRDIEHQVCLGIYKAASDAGGMVV